MPPGSRFLHDRDTAGDEGFPALLVKSMPMNPRPPPTLGSESVTAQMERAQTAPSRIAIAGRLWNERLHPVQVVGTGRPNPGQRN